MITASAGGLCTVLSLTIIENETWKIIVASLGAILAIAGAVVMTKSKK